MLCVCACTCHNSHCNSDSTCRLMLRGHQMKCLPRSARWWRPSEQDSLLHSASVSLRKSRHLDQTHPRTQTPQSLFTFCFTHLHLFSCTLSAQYVCCQLDHSTCLHCEVSRSYCHWERSLQINVKSAISTPHKIRDRIIVLRCQCAPFMLSCTARHFCIVSSMQELQLSLTFCAYN